MPEHNEKSHVSHKGETISYYHIRLKKQHICTIKKLELKNNHLISNWLIDYRFISKGYRVTQCFFQIGKARTLGVTDTQWFP